MEEERNAAMTIETTKRRNDNTKVPLAVVLVVPPFFLFDGVNVVEDTSDLDFG